MVSATQIGMEDASRERILIILCLLLFSTFYSYQLTGTRLSTISYHNSRRNQLIEA